MKNYVNEVYTRTFNIEQKMGGAQATVQQVGGGAAAVQHDPNMMAALNEIRGHVQQIRTTQLNQGGASAAAIGGCDNIPCVSSTIFLAVVIVQSGIILTFIFLRYAARLNLQLLMPPFSGASRIRPSSTRCLLDVRRLLPGFAVSTSVAV